MKKSSLKKLIAIYDAIGGLYSECPDPFDQMYEGGTEKLINDFTAILKECGVKFAECIKGRYYVVSYKGQGTKKWGICTDKTAPNASWVLTGFSNPDEAVNLIKNPKYFEDYDGTPVEVIDAA